MWPNGPAYSEMTVKTFWKITGLKNLPEFIIHG
jgi:hypothetical protein